MNSIYLLGAAFLTPLLTSNPAQAATLIFDFTENGGGNFGNQATLTDTEGSGTTVTLTAFKDIFSNQAGDIQVRLAGNISTQGAGVSGAPRDGTNGAQRNAIGSNATNTEALSLEFTPSFQTQYLLSSFTVGSLRTDGNPQANRDFSIAVDNLNFAEGTFFGITPNPNGTTTVDFANTPFLGDLQGETFFFSVPNANDQYRILSATFEEVAVTIPEPSMFIGSMFALCGWMTVFGRKVRKLDKKST